MLKKNVIKNQSSRKRIEEDIRQHEIIKKYILLEKEMRKVESKSNMNELKTEKMQQKQKILI